jgi:amino acid permease
VCSFSKTTDLITLSIAGIFGGLVLVVVFGFILLMRRDSRQRYESKDYFRWARRAEARKQQPERGYTSYSSKWDRNSSSASDQSQYGPDARTQRNIAIIVVCIAVGAIAISVWTNNMAGLLLIFLLPLIVRFLNLRQRGGRRNTANGNDSSSSSV